MTHQRKRILAFVLMGLFLGLTHIIVLFVAISSSPFFDLEQSVNTCYSGKLEGKTNQEIADLLGYPLVTLSRIPANLPDEPRVFTQFTDTDCWLVILYGLYTDQSNPLEIRVVSSNTNDQNTDGGWKCNEDPSVTFETICYGNTQYLGKYYGIMLRSPYSLAETQALTAFVEIPA
jgi:hypothetical protein